MILSTFLSIILYLLHFKSLSFQQVDSFINFQPLVQALSGSSFLQHILGSLLSGRTVLICGEDKAFISSLVKCLSVFVPFSNSFFYSTYRSNLYTICEWIETDISIKTLSSHRIKLAGIKKIYIQPKIEVLPLFLFFIFYFIFKQLFTSIVFINKEIATIFKGPKYIGTFINEKSIKQFLTSETLDTEGYFASIFTDIDNFVQVSKLYNSFKIVSSIQNVMSNDPDFIPFESLTKIQYHLRMINQEKTFTIAGQTVSNKEVCY